MEHVLNLVFDIVVSVDVVVAGAVHLLVCHRPETEELREKHQGNFSLQFVNTLRLFLRQSTALTENQIIIFCQKY